MPTPFSQKLKIKPKDILLALNAPPEFKKTLKDLPAGVKIIDTGKDYTQVHWFVLTKAQVDKETAKVMKLLKEGVILWTYFPKGSSKLQTDLTRDKGWDTLELAKLQWLGLISFDDTWSVFAVRLKTDADKKKASASSQQREIFNWVNPTTKEVRLPDELIAAFKKNKKANAFFDALSFSHKKEYIEWIVTAKREETKAERVKGTIERLEKSWKNPRNL